MKKFWVRKKLKKRWKKETPKQTKPILKEYKPIPPFLSRLKSTKREQVDEEIMDTFRKVEVNIPLLDVIKQVPRYAKGVLEDVLVQVNELIFPADFYTLGMGILYVSDKNSIILGRPFSENC